MQLKEVKPANFLFYRTEARIQELKDLIPVSQQLYREAVACKLSIVGPIHWHYHGFTGHADQSFWLEISLPVAQVPPDYDGLFHVKRTEPFRCVSLIHEGSWYAMPSSYARAMQFVKEHNLRPNATNREIYIHVDVRSPEANVTEIQLGIQ